MDQDNDQNKTREPRGLDAQLQQQDDFFSDLNRIRVQPNYPDQVGVKKRLLTVPVRKPNPQEFVRVHPDAAYRIEAYLFQFKEDHEYYLIDPQIAPHLTIEAKRMRLALMVNRQGTVALWPLRMMGKNGKSDRWMETALEAANMAMSKWVRVESDMDLGGYQVYESAAPLDEPTFPTESMSEILRAAFKERLINSTDHMVIKKLEGKE